MATKTNEPNEPLVPLSVVLKAIEDEPEFPGTMSQEMYEGIINNGKDTMEETLRISVRLTKKGISNRIKKIIQKP